jgi:hypothetical protein
MTQKFAAQIPNPDEAPLAFWKMQSQNLQTPETVRAA